MAAALDPRYQNSQCHPACNGRRAWLGTSHSGYAQGDWKKDDKGANKAKAQIKKRANEAAPELNITEGATEFVMQSTVLAGGLAGLCILGIRVFCHHGVTHEQRSGGDKAGSPHYPPSDCPGRRDAAGESTAGSRPVSCPLKSGECATAICPLHHRTLSETRLPRT